MRTNLYITLLLLCYNNGPSAEASPLPDSGSSGGSDVSTKPPDLSSMLNVFSGGVDISTLLNFIKHFKDITYVINQSMKNSPLIKSVIDTAEKKNVKLRVLMKGVDGKFPDFKDLYDLATTKTNGISADIIASAMSNANYVKFKTLMLNDTFGNPSTISELFNLFTGRTIHLKPTALKELKGGKYTVAANISIPDRNLLEILLFYRENALQLITLFSVIGSDPSDMTRIVPLIKKVDFSFFSKIMSQNTTDGKYAITGSGNDPDVVHLMQEVKKLEALNEPIATNKAETIFFDMVEKVVKITFRLMHEAGSAPVTSGKEQKQGRPGVVG